jgi:hypothetical protein
MVLLGALTAAGTLAAHFAVSKHQRDINEQIFGAE